MFKKPMMHSELNKILWRINQNIEQFEEDGLILWEGLRIVTGKHVYVSFCVPL